MKYEWHINNFPFLQPFSSCLDVVLQAQVCILIHFDELSMHTVLFPATFVVWFMFFSYVHHLVSGSLSVSGSVFTFLMCDFHNMFLPCDLNLIAIRTLILGMFKTRFAQCKGLVGS
jgi:hypothetical protein